LFEEQNYEDCPQNGFILFYFIHLFFQFNDLCDNIKFHPGLMLKSLKRNHSKEASNIIDWMELGCFDALEKQYVYFLLNYTSSILIT